MRAVVLVGGEGTRLRPLTYSVPKQMLPIAQLPMIERVLEQLSRHGVKEVVLSLGYKPEVFQEHFSDGTWRDVTIQFAVEPPTLLDTAGAIAFAAREADISETFIAVNGDVLTDFDVSKLIEFHRANNAEGTIALTPVDDPSRFGVVPTDSDGRVTAFIEKPKREEAPTNFINAGIYVLESSFLDLVPAGERVSIERQTFPAMVEKNTLFALESDAYWLDTGTSEKYLQANIDYLHGLRPLPPLPAAKQQGTNWLVGESAIESETNNSLVGTHCVIGADCKVESSVIGSGVRIASGTVIESSVLFDGCEIGSGVSISNSVIGSNTKVLDHARIEDNSIVGFDDVVQSHTTVSNTRVGVK